MPSIEIPSQYSSKFTATLLDGAQQLAEYLCEVDLYSYQVPIFRRIMESLIIGDAEEITVLIARQGGKSQTVAVTIATAMVLLPVLAKAFPDHPILQKFKKGCWIGVFAPNDEQATTIHSRVVGLLISDRAKELLEDPDFGYIVRQRGILLYLEKDGQMTSLCRRQTCHPKAKVESKTYHLAIIDEAQDSSSLKVRQAVHPTLTAVAGTIVKIGTPTIVTGDFYEAIRRNMRRITKKVQNHFEANYTICAKANPFYAKAVALEKERLGEDSDEFKMAYMLIWLIDRGMLVTSQQIEELGDPTLEIMHSWAISPCVAGIDWARKVDSTVVTVAMVDWEHPDEFGYHNHYILNWLELHGENWETQYYQICDFLSNYYIMSIGIDDNGMGGPASERLQLMLPNIQIELQSSSPIEQSQRWKHLMELLLRNRMHWPASPRARQTKLYKRFTAQLSDAEKNYRGKHVTVAAPKVRNAHDDFVDSMALMAWMSSVYTYEPTVEIQTNMFYSK